MAHDPPSNGAIIATKPPVPCHPVGVTGTGTGQIARFGGQDRFPKPPDGAGVKGLLTMWVMVDATKPGQRFGSR